MDREGNDGRQFCSMYYPIIYLEGEPWKLQLELASLRLDIWPPVPPGWEASVQLTQQQQHSLSKHYNILKLRRI
jgi:hypothetical protein